MGQNLLGFIWIFFAVALVVNLILAAAFSGFAGKRGLSRRKYFLLTFFLSLLVAVLVYFSEKGSAHNSIASAGTVACPYCAEPIRLEANVCRYCGKDVAKKLAPLVAEAATKANEVHRATQAAQETRKEFFAKRSTKVGIALGAVLVLVASISLFAAFKDATKSEQDRVLLDGQQAYESCSRQYPLVHLKKHVFDSRPSEEYPNAIPAARFDLYSQEAAKDQRIVECFANSVMSDAGEWAISVNSSGEYAVLLNGTPFCSKVRWVQRKRTELFCYRDSDGIFHFGLGYNF